MLLVVGSYEQMLLGYDLLNNGKSGEDVQLEATPAFTDHSHTGYVKTIASSNSALASGSTDERIWSVFPRVF